MNLVNGNSEQDCQDLREIEAKIIAHIIARREKELGREEPNSVSFASKVLNRLRSLIR